MGGNLFTQSHAGHVIAEQALYFVHAYIARETIITIALMALYQVIVFVQGIVAGSSAR